MTTTTLAANVNTAPVAGRGWREAKMWGGIVLAACAAVALLDTVVNAKSPVAPPPFSPAMYFRHDGVFQPVPAAPATSTPSNVDETTTLS